MITLSKAISHVNNNLKNRYYHNNINDSSPATTPLRAIRRFCIECVGSPYEINDCGGDKCLDGQGDENGVCYFYGHRMGRGRPSVKLIRKMCLECMEGSSRLVAECRADCELHRFRFGKNPNISDERREKQRVIALRMGWGGG